jgi:hypothetical protein
MQVLTWSAHVSLSVEWCAMQPIGGLQAVCTSHV